MHFFGNLTTKGIIAVILSRITGIAIIVISILEIYPRMAVGMAPTEYLTSLIYFFIGIPLLVVARGVLKLERWVRPWGLIFSIASFMTGLFSSIALATVGWYPYMDVFGNLIEFGWWQVIITSIILMYLFAGRYSRASFVKD